MSTDPQSKHDGEDAAQPAAGRDEHVCCGTRRQFLWQAGAGFAGLALTSILDRDGFFSKVGYAREAPDAALNPLAVKVAHFPPRAKSCIFLFMYGGPSHVDFFDYKPELQRRDGQSIDMEIRRRSVRKSRLMGSRRRFRRWGETGQWCSDAFPRLAQHMDKLAVIKSLYVDSFTHGSAVLQMNSGQTLQGHPALGSWLAYGLGTLNQDLPSYVVMLDPRGGPISGAANWTSGYMPAAYQGTVFRSAGDAVLDMTPTPRAGGTLSREMQLTQIEAVNELNAMHLADRPGYSELQARIASYELAFRLQSAGPEALDLSQEDEATKEMYGLYDPKSDHKLSVGPAPFGRQCLIARRLIERGVRFVQIYHGGGHQQQNWDAHHGQEENIEIHCPEVDKPISALLTDLDRRGLLKETLVLWGGEFGRQPVVQESVGSGRDHNPKGFTMWLAGAGVKPGSYGETDEIGAEAVVNRHHVRDLHATILHLMGLDPDKLTYFYGGLERKLIGPQGADVIRGILA